MKDGAKDSSSIVAFDDLKTFRQKIELKKGYDKDSQFIPKDPAPFVNETKAKSDDLANKVLQERKGSELWPWLIGAVFFLLVLESFLANRWAPRD